MFNSVATIGSSYFPRRDMRWALHILYYNFTLKMSPDMTARISKRLWEMKNVVDMA